MSFTRQQAPLGLGHAVWCARELVGDEPFAVLLPDMIMQGEPGCLAQMIAVYNETGGNVDRGRGMRPGRRPPSTASSASARRSASDAFRITAHGREAGAGGRAVEPLHQRPLHPAAGRSSTYLADSSAAPATRSSSPTP